MKKKVEKQEKENKTVSVTRIIRDNYAWFIAVLTFLGVMFLNILRFSEYVISSFYFDYYGLDINLYKYYDQNFLYSLCTSIIFGLAFAAVLFCFKQIYDNFKRKNYICKQNLYNLFIIIYSNCYLISDRIESDNIYIKVLGLIVLLLFEYFVSRFVFFADIEIEDGLSGKELLIDCFKKFPFVIILIMILISLNCYTNLTLRKEYRLINNSKVIVYSNSDYFLTLDCEIQNEKLIIYKGTQQKITSDDVYSKLIEFKNVKIK